MPEDENTEQQPDGITDVNEILFVNGLGLMDEWTPVNDPEGDPNIDQMRAFMNDSFVFTFVGHQNKNPDEQIAVTIAMPQEAVMFIITQAMQRAQKQGQLVVGDPMMNGLGMPPMPGMDHKPIPPGGLILP